MKDERKKEKAGYKSPEKEAFTPGQLAAVIEHETAIGIYDGRYDDSKPVEEVAGDVVADAVAEPEEKKKGGWPKGKKRG